jgi:serine/threonine protein kinase
MSQTPLSAGESFRGPDYPASPIPNFPGSPNPYRQSFAPSFPLLVNGFINPTIISSQGQSLSGWFYEMARSQRWEPSLLRKIWSWALTNQKIALLLVLCEDVASWRQAAFHYLRDENLPFPEDRLHGIVADPRRVVSEQWRATAKELPLNGSHVEFAVRETLPLQQISPVRTLRSPETSADQVQMLGGNDERVFLRKRFVITRPSQKATLIKQVNDFKQYDHKNIAKILSSYSQPSHVGIITVKAQYTLDDYLALSSNDPNRPKVLLDWMQDLAQALEYIHSQSMVVDNRIQSICHRSLRPRKILIDGSRIYLAPFGIGTHNNDWLSPSVPSPQRLDQLQSYFQDQTYIYAAPESTRSRSKRPADVFSLGCVFLSMMTVVQNQPLSMFTHYRAGSSQDASFHAHLDRVNAWRQRLLSSVNSALRNGVIGPGRKQRQLRSEADWLQHIIPRMLDQQPKDRIKMGRLVAQLGKLGDGAAGGGRRRSLDEGGLSGKAASALGINPNAVNGGHGSSANTGGNRKPELSVFDGYFQQQERRYEQGPGW